MTRLILAAVIGLTTALPAAAQFKNAEAAIRAWASCSPT